MKSIDHHDYPPDVDARPLDTDTPCSYHYSPLFFSTPFLLRNPPLIFLDTAPIPLDNFPPLELSHAAVLTESPSAQRR